MPKRRRNREKERGRIKPAVCFQAAGKGLATGYMKKKNSEQEGLALTHMPIW